MTGQLSATWLTFAATFSAIGELQRTECKDGTCRDWYEKTLLENQRVASLCNFFPWFAVAVLLFYIYIYVSSISAPSIA